MSSTATVPGSDVDARRENARRANGEFGTQTHDDPGIVEVLEAQDETESSDRVYKGVSAYGYELMRQRVDKINARASKRGFTGSFELTAEHRTVSETDESGFIREHDVLDVTLVGTAPRYDGWTFLATVEPVELADGTTEFILKSPPWRDETQVDRSVLQEGWCDHCQTTRHNRRKIFLVRNDDGETKQVGSTCIKDFLGWSAGSPYMPDADEIDDELRGCYISGGAPEDFDTTYSVAVSLAAAKEYGWQPASGQNPTRGVVLTALQDNKEMGRKVRAALAPHMESAAAEAPQVISTVLANIDTSTDFGANLSIALRTGHTNYSRMGLVAATVSAYQRIMQVKAEKATIVPSEWVGQKGDKISPTVTVLRADTVDGFAWNTTQRMLVLKTSDGNVLKAYSAAGWSYDVGPGDTFVMDATVKGHDEFRDTKQTIVTRIKRRLEAAPVDAEKAAS